MIDGLDSNITSIKFGRLSTSITKIPSREITIINKQIVLPSKKSDNTESHKSDQLMEKFNTKKLEVPKIEANDKQKKYIYSFCKLFKYT